jgi:TM2 domain-containing membrane protein YozV
VTGHVGTGFLMLLLNGLGWLTFWFGLGFLIWGALGLWWLIDALLIPGLVRS